MLPSRMTCYDSCNTEIVVFMIGTHLSWSKFEVAASADGKSNEFRFESLCRQLFANEFVEKESYQRFLQSVVNNPGIESEPIYNEKEKIWIGFQAKYFSKYINYDSIMNSCRKAVTHYKGKLDKLILFCNLQPSPKSKTFKEAEKLLRFNNMTLTTIAGETILDLVRKYDKLKEYYFGQALISDEWMWEHDKDMMLEADYIIDMGPKAGRLGGEVVFSGTPQEMMKTNTMTSQYLNGSLQIAIPLKRRQGNGKSICLKGAHGNNLKNVDVEFPLGKLICVTGVSGSGKSTLINETLQPILSQKFYHSLQAPLEYGSINGVEYIDKVVTVDQSPIGRTPRSNPATYTGVFSDIRNLYAELPEAKMRGYKAGRFSFNIAGGRCEACGGNGYKTIEMNFLPDVYIPCEVCYGKRYNRETLEVRFKGKSIADVLEMTINRAVEFFENVPQILNKIKVLQDVGLGYIKLGQSSTTLSGGESQRVKLATELSKRDTGKTLYILDEPTTGLHFEDIRVLMDVLNKLVDKDNTVIVIEHNLDVIKTADYIIDMGPEGGKKGGRLLICGTPEEIALSEKGYTSKFLRKELGL